MALHVLHDVTLSVDGDGLIPQLGLTHLLDDLSFVRTASTEIDAPALSLSVRLGEAPVRVPRGGRARFQADGLRAVELRGVVYLSDGSSLLRLRSQQGRGDAWLALRFSSQSRLLQQRFWAYGLLELLRPKGLYGLHAAAVATASGLNLLLAGPSGCGKSTLTIGLLRLGCRYLSDDAVLLRSARDGIEALSFRKPFSIESSAATEYPDLALGPDRLSPSGKRKRRADVRSTYSDQHLAAFRPNVIVFPTIVRRARSVLRPIAQAKAVGHLLEQSGPELFDASTMTQHLSLLTRLVRQTAIYELYAGADLRRRPGVLLDLLSNGEGPERG